MRQGASSGRSPAPLAVNLTGDRHTIAGAGSAYLKPVWWKVWKQVESPKSDTETYGQAACPLVSVTVNVHLASSTTEKLWQHGLLQCQTPTKQQSHQIQSQKCTREQNMKQCFTQACPTESFAHGCLMQRQHSPTPAFTNVSNNDATVVICNQSLNPLCTHHSCAHS